MTINWNSSNAEGVFDLKIPLIGSQTKQQRREKFRKTSRIIQAKICPIGPLLVFEQFPEDRKFSNRQNA